MDVEKIKSLISELKQDIEVKSEALQGLVRLLSSTNGHKSLSPADQMSQQDSVRVSVGSPHDSYIELAVKLITANEGRPMRVKDLVERMRAVKGDHGVERRSVEATFYRHISAKGEGSRIVKVSPGVYGLRRYPREETAA